MGLETDVLGLFVGGDWARVGDPVDGGGEGDLRQLSGAVGVWQVDGGLGEIHWGS